MQSCTPKELQSYLLCYSVRGPCHAWPPLRALSGAQMLPRLHPPIACPTAVRAAQRCGRARLDCRQLLCAAGAQATAADIAGGLRAVGAARASTPVHGARYVHFGARTPSAPCATTTTTTPTHVAHLLQQDHHHGQEGGGSERG